MSTLLEENVSPVLVYVDGSYNRQTNLTGCGVVIVKDDIVYKKGFLAKTEEGHSWNIDGECQAVLEALKICAGLSKINGVTIDEKDIVINYDYEGIEKWVTREWKVKSKVARDYVQEFDRLVEDHKINYSFNKVKAHSGDKYNDIADGLANALVTVPKK